MACQKLSFVSRPPIFYSQQNGAFFTCTKYFVFHLQQVRFFLFTSSTLYFIYIKNAVFHRHQVLCLSSTSITLVTYHRQYIVCSDCLGLILQLQFLQLIPSHIGKFFRLLDTASLYASRSFTVALCQFTFLDLHS